jgi:myo-inositol-1(or 4)-monophosphatase
MDKFVKNLALGAGKILKDGFGKKLRITSKLASWDLQTQYDLISEKYITEKIRKKYPNHGIVAEEGGYSKKEKDFWVIDPLDGTSAFINNIPGFCVSIAFVSDNDIKMGVIYAPMSKEMFFAEKGKGAFLNGKKISISQKKKLDQLDIYQLMHLTNTTRTEKLQLYKNIVKYKLVPRTSGGAAAMSLCFLACGRYDAIFIKGIYPWDYAAGALIMKEAGAKVTDFKNRSFLWDSPSIVAANPVLHKKIMKEFKL